MSTFRDDDLEKEMATPSSVLAWRIPGTGGAWWAAVYGVAQSQTRLKRLSSSSSRDDDKIVSTAWTLITESTLTNSYCLNISHTYTHTYTYGILTILHGVHTSPFIS